MIYGTYFNQIEWIAHTYCWGRENSIDKWAIELLSNYLYHISNAIFLFTSGCPFLVTVVKVFLDRKGEVTEGGFHSHILRATRSQAKIVIVGRQSPQQSANKCDYQPQSYTVDNSQKDTHDCGRKETCYVCQLGELCKNMKRFSFPCSRLLEKPVRGLFVLLMLCALDWCPSVW